MSRKRLLNIASTKKSDTMLPVAATPTGGSPSPGQLAIPGNVVSLLAWCPTARARNAIPDSNANWNRSADTIFLRGLKETINIQNLTSSTTNANSWQWRRVVFSVKGLYQSLGTSVDHLYTASNGYVRFLADQNGTGFGTNITELIFKGRFNLDWIDAFNAKLDTSKVNVFYDKTRQLIPQSSARRVWQFKMWHPFNKNLVYQNEESGGSGETASIRSTLSKPGIGDVYVVDFFQCVTSAAGDTLGIGPEATLYWHEK